jgi:hypothetical protein
MRNPNIIIKGNNVFIKMELHHIEVKRINCFHFYSVFPWDIVVKNYSNINITKYKHINFW